MKIIVSHDVDHLYPSDHIFRDLIFPKLWIRGSIQLIKGEITFSNWANRLLSILDKRLNRIPEIVKFDKDNGVKSTFFFGMDNILGMSYQKDKAKKWIQYVIDNGFDAGVHGVEIDNIDKMRVEYNSFKQLSSLDSFGIRTHYVRYNDTTFSKMAKVGYLFDTSEFCKDYIDLKPYYKIENMWEFPLHIMDGYVMKNNLLAAKEDVIVALGKAEKGNIEYVTFLFHDYMFNDKTYSKDKEFYIWFIEYCKRKNYEFISYKEVIN